jgi:hypothetical protein
VTSKGDDYLISRSDRRVDRREQISQRGVSVTDISSMQSDENSCVFLVLWPGCSEFYFHFEYFFQVLLSIRSPNPRIINATRPSFVGCVSRPNPKKLSTRTNQPSRLRQIQKPLNPSLLLPHPPTNHPWPPTSQSSSTPSTAISPSVRVSLSSQCLISYLYLSLVVAEAEKKGIEAAGGSATIYQ